MFPNEFSLQCFLVVCTSISSNLLVSGDIIERQLGNYVDVKEYKNDYYNKFCSSGQYIRSSSELQCSGHKLINGCCWANRNVDQAQVGFRGYDWLYGFGRPDPTLVRQYFRTEKLPSSKFLVLTSFTSLSLGGLVDSLFASCPIRCTEDEIQVSIRYFITGSASLEVCLTDPDQKTAPTSCKILPKNKQPGPAVVHLPRATTPTSIALVARNLGQFSLIVVDDVQVNFEECTSNTANQDPNLNRLQYPTGSRNLDRLDQSRFSFSRPIRDESGNIISLKQANPELSSFNVADYNLRPISPVSRVSRPQSSSFLTRPNYGQYSSHLRRPNYGQYRPQYRYRPNIPLNAATPRRQRLDLNKSGFSSGYRRPTYGRPTYSKPSLNNVPGFGRPILAPQGQVSSFRRRPAVFPSSFRVQPSRSNRNNINRKPEPIPPILDREELIHSQHIPRDSQRKNRNNITQELLVPEEPIPEPVQHGDHFHLGVDAKEKDPAPSCFLAKTKSGNVAASTRNEPFTIDEFVDRAFDIEEARRQAGTSPLSQGQSQEATGGIRFGPDIIAHDFDGKCDTLPYSGPDRFICPNENFCGWRAESNIASLTWRKANGLPPRQIFRQIFGDLQPNTPKFMVLHAPSSVKPHDKASIVTCPIECPDPLFKSGPVTVRFRYWRSPNVRLEVCLSDTLERSYKTCSEVSTTGELEPRVRKTLVHRRPKKVIQPQNFVVEINALNMYSNDLVVIDDLTLNFQDCAGRFKLTASLEAPETPDVEPVNRLWRGGSARAAALNAKISPLWEPPPVFGKQPDPVNVCVNGPLPQGHITTFIGTHFCNREGPSRSRRCDAACKVHVTPNIYSSCCRGVSRWNAVGCFCDHALVPQNSVRSLTRADYEEFNLPETSGFDQESDETNVEILRPEGQFPISRESSNNNRSAIIPQQTTSVKLIPVRAENTFPRGIFSAQEKEVESKESVEQPKSVEFASSETEFEEYSFLDLTDAAVHNLPLLPDQENFESLDDVFSETAFKPVIPSFANAEFNLNDTESSCSLPCDFESNSLCGWKPLRVLGGRTLTTEMELFSSISFGNSSAAVVTPRDSKSEKFLGASLTQHQEAAIEFSPFSQQEETILRFAIYKSSRFMNVKVCFDELFRSCPLMFGHSIQKRSGLWNVYSMRIPPDTKRIIISAKNDGDRDSEAVGFDDIQLLKWEDNITEASTNKCK